MRSAPAPPPGLRQAVARVAAIKRRFRGLGTEFGEVLSRVVTASHHFRTKEGVWAEGSVRRAIASAAQGVGISADLLLAVAEVESGLRSDAISPKGALGLMQLMPGTAAALGVVDAFDIEENARGGARYLRELLDRFGGDIGLALAAYNAGPGAVERYGGIPPFAETQRFVARVLARAAAARANTAPGTDAGGGLDARYPGSLKLQAQGGEDTGSTSSPSMHDRYRASDNRDEPPPSGDPPGSSPGFGGSALPGNSARSHGGGERGAGG